MKGNVIPMIFFVILTVIILFISISMLLPLEEDFEMKSTEILSKLKIRGYYGFQSEDILKDKDDSEALSDYTDYTNYFVNDITNGDNNQYCIDVMECVKESILTSEPCEIEIKFNMEFSSAITDVILNPSHCGVEDLFVETGDETLQQVCKFDPSDGFTIYEKTFLENEYVTSSDYKWDKCVKPHMPFIYGGYLYSEFNVFCEDQDSDSYVFFPTPRSYSITGTPSYDYNFNAYTYGGTLKIAIYNAGVANDAARSCNFSMMVTPQPAIGNSTDSIVYKIFERAHFLESQMLQKGKELGDYPYDSFVGDEVTVESIFGYYPRFFEFDLPSDDVPNLDAVTEALRVGIIEWGKLHYRDTSVTRKYNVGPYSEDYFDAQFITVKPVEWKRESGASIPITYDNGCWNDDWFEKNIDYNADSVQPTIYYSGDYTNPSKMRIVIALYKKELEKQNVYYYGEMVEDDAHNPLNVNVLEIIPYITMCVK
ncbi:MAG: hypothetical protein GOV02_01015 [Candidatus Aenigmarchaeota archaeon]|nr:hypothetical protein [Candidatus Aenigmarchaeota archaeon]